MKTFVTGGTGFIGRALLRVLVDEGPVTALYRPTSDREGLDLPNLRWAEGDLVNLDSLRRGIRGCQRVYHIGALVRSWAPDPSEFDRCNVLGTRNLLQAALEEKVEQIVHTSSVMAIGPSGATPADESTARKIPAASPYERTKELAEREVFHYLDKGLPVVLVLPGLVYGPCDRFTRYSFNRFLSDYLRGRLPGIPGDGERSLSAVYIDDVVQGHRLAMEKGRTGERYILGGENTTPNQLIRTIAELTGRRRKVRRIPFALAYAFAVFSEWQARWTGLDPWVNRCNLINFGRDWAYSSRKAEQELGYRHRPFREGIAGTIDWLVREGMLDKHELFS
jgi:nucleoside-diphosphate-sugar epimerase